MAENQMNEATWNSIKSMSDTNQTILSGAVAAQERNLAFARSVLENGVEVLRSHMESNRTLLRELADRSQEQSTPGALRTLVENTIEAQERNTRYAQSVLENGIETLKSQAEVAHTTMQELGQQAQKQQEAFQALMHESVNAYMDFLRTPFVYYQQILNATEAATRQSLENFQRTAREGLENMQRATRQAKQTTAEAGNYTE